MGFSVSSTDGVLLGVHRVKDATIGLYDRKDGSFEYTVEEGVLIDADSSRCGCRASTGGSWTSSTRTAAAATRPIDVAWRDAGTEGSRAVDVVLGRARN